jgi:hypothetical protein
MALLGAKTEAINPKLLTLFVPPPDNKKSLKKWAYKELAKESDGILAILRDSGEECQVLAHDTGTNSNMIVVTDRRTFQVKRGKIRKAFAHSEVELTKLLSTPDSGDGGMLVEVETYAYRRDYSPQDLKRYEAMILAKVATPGVANAVCAHIDKYIETS